MVNNGEKVWVVTAQGGMYEDSWESIVGVYSSEEEAKNVAREFDKYHCEIDNNPRLNELGEEFCDEFYYSDYSDGDEESYNFHGSAVSKIKPKYLEKYGISEEDAALIQLYYNSHARDYSPCYISEFEIGLMAGNN